LTSVDAFKNAITTGDAVRALCVADIVIADVTGYDPSVLLLLGIRAAVRRGVTIACTTQELSQLLWKELPFNLKELNLISFHNQDEGHANLLSAILLGLRQSGVSPRYLDLPVYDYVREDTGGGAANDPYRVLLLRAFDSGSGSSQIIYGGARKALINDGIREARSLPASATIETVIDQVSPRLAGQRLYEAIRHWQTCVVDLTWWRANVLFELGVRLAVQAKGTYCFIDESEEPGQTYRGSRALLKELLKPFRYDRTTQNFSEAFLAPVAPLIYDAAARHFRREQDRFNDDVDKMLLEAAAVAPGDDPLQAIDLAPLYARDNQEYGAALKQSVFERLCAAWMYLAGRNRPDTFRPIDLLDPHRAAVFQAFFRLGSRLKAVIALRREDRDRWLQGEIERSEGDARKSGASEMAALLAEWDGIRRGNPLWRIERATIKDGGWDDLVDDCEHQIEQLSRLRFELRSLDNSVCEMPLQGIESNLRHLKIALGRFQRRDP
jgi:hypothetical protein